MQLGDFKFERTGQTMKRIAAIMRGIFKSQAPQRRNGNPYATGWTRDSIQVTPVQRKGGEWDIEIDYVEHGKYSLWGTRPYRNPDMETESLFGIPAWRAWSNDSKGEGGIRPQYWLSLRGHEDELMDPIEQDLEQDMLTFIDTKVQNLQNRR